VTRFQILTVTVLLVRIWSVLKHNMVWRVSFSSKSVQDMEVKFDMTTRHKVVFACLQAANAPYFLLAIHIVVSICHRYSTALSSDIAS